MIYLDYAANTPADPRVLAAFVRTERAFPGNPNAAHAAGQAAAEALEAAAADTAALLGVQPREIVFTSGATEANNLAVKGIAQASRHIGRHIVSTAAEHPSVSAALTYLHQQGWEIDLVGLTAAGTVDLQQLSELLRPDTVLAAFSAVESELGTVQPIAQIAALVKDVSPRCRLHIDAAQAAGKIPLSLDGADTVTLSPHKFYGLNGVGILIRREGTALTPQIHGGNGATPYRSGTPALALAVSAREALSLALSHQAAWAQQAAALHRQLLHGLAARPGVQINTPPGAVPHIVNLSVEGIRGGAFQSALSRRGVCVSVKSACSAEGTPSRPVLAVSRSRRRALSSWRISLSHLTTPEEIETFLTHFDACRRELAPEKAPAQT